MSQELIHDCLAIATRRPRALLRLDMKEDRNPILALINWLAICMVPGAHESAATAVSMTQTGDFILHVALSTGPPTLAQRHAADGLLCAMHSIYEHPSDRGKDATMLLRTIIPHSWPYFIHKVARLRATCTPLDIFDSMVDSWVEYRQSRKSKSTETSRGMKILADKFTGGDTVAMIKQCYASIVEHARDIPLEPSSSYFFTVVTRVDALLRSKFFRDAMDGTWPKAENRFVRLYRRLRRVRALYFGACNFIGPNCTFLRKRLATDTPGRFQIQWAADSLSCSALSSVMTHSMSPPERCAALAAQCYQLPNALETKLIDVFLAKRPASTTTWDAGASTTLRLHPEMQMMAHLDVGRIVVLEDRIGTSKYICYCCLRFLDALPSPVPWVFSSKTAVVSERDVLKLDWLAPQASPRASFLTEDVVHKAVEAMAAGARARIMDEMVNWYYNRHMY